MSSDRAVALREDRSRRRFLAGCGTVAFASLAGCSDPRSDGGDDRAEVIVENNTESAATIAVRVIDREGSALFSDVFALDSEAIVSRDAVETTPLRVHAFTPNGVSRTWRYDPDLPIEFDCEPKDVGLTLHRDDTIEPWYDC